MTVINHIIRRQSVDFTYTGKTNGLALQKEVQDWCEFSLIPGIEAELDSCAPGDRFISIDRLEITAVTDRGDWKQKIKDELVFSLKRKLSEQIPVAAEEKIPAGRSVERKLDELVLFYFEKGYLPWWSGSVITGEFEVALQQWLVEEKTATRAEAIVHRLKQIQSSKLINRLLHALPGKKFFRFCETLFFRQKKLVSQAEEFMRLFVGHANLTANQKKIREPIRRALMVALLKSESLIEIIPRILHAAISYQQLPALTIPTGIGKVEGAHNPFIAKWNSILETEQRVVKKMGEVPYEKEKSEQVRFNYNKLVDGLRETIDAEPGSNLEEDLQEGIYIDNAGVVIAAAFLPALFSRLKISKDEVLIKPALAAMLIQYLASGKSKTTEHHLVLPKILCGIPLEDAVDINTRISSAQVKQANEMLHAVTEYWTPLKNSSVQGLRESFLQRGGKLSLINNEWMLQVEQRAFDMLLQQLPWSISMIKLPWMKNVLRTEWC